MVDHHVDRPDVKAPQGVQLTGTNRSFDLIVLILNEDPRGRISDDPPDSPTELIRPVCFTMLRRQPGDRTPSDPRRLIFRSLFFAGLVAFAR